MTLDESPYFAAVDLGSNSFHMIIARENEQTVEIIDRVKDMVQVAKGLENNVLSSESKARAVECLSRFAERLRDIPASHIKAVGTKTLRSAKNAGKFIKEAEKALGHPIEIISGYEEARLVYKGLARGVSNDGNTRLVVDIGGGSTEFIIGKDAEPEMLESLSLGCVTFTEKFKLNQKLTENNMRAAYIAARSELELIRKPYINRSWDICYGTSGTIRAIADLLSDGGAIITKQALKDLRSTIVEKDEERLKSLPKLRRDVLPAGIAILSAIFDALKLEKIHAADATLKDGLVHEIIGRFHNVDARFMSVAKLQKKYSVDTAQADRVAAMALHFWETIANGSIPGVSRRKILKWAAELHEVGLGISHSSYHNHGHYILKHSDLAGFGRYEQYILACLVQAHRKKIKEDVFSSIEENVTEAMMPLVVCLRLAVQLCRRREDLDHKPTLTGKAGTYTLEFDGTWLSDNPLTAANLETERHVLNKAGMTLTITEKRS